MPRIAFRTASLAGGLASLVSLATLAQEAKPLLESYIPVTYAEIENPDPSEWLMWRRTQNHWGYSRSVQRRRHLMPKV